MTLVKRLIFALPFLGFWVLANLQLPTILQNPHIILSTDLNLIIQLSTLVIYLILSGIFFAVFATIANNWRYVIPIIFISSVIPLLLLTPPLSYILTLGCFFSFIIVQLLLNRELGSYLTFKPTMLLTPSIKRITTLLLLIISFSFYLVAEEDITKNGFKVPSSLIEMSLSLTQTGQSLEVGPAANLNQLQIPPDQLEYLKQNPQLLQQYGMDPAVLEELDKPQGKPQDTMAALVEGQINNMIKPYQQFIPLVLTLLLFVTLKWIASILSILLSPLVWLIFWVLEKTGFTKYQTEMREVKKLIV